MIFAVNTLPLFLISFRFKFFVYNFYTFYSIFCVRCSREAVFCKKGVLKIFAKLTGTHVCKFFFNKEPPVQAFPCEFTKFLRTPFL